MYILTIFVLLLFYSGLLLIMKRLNNKTIVNYLVVLFSLCFYISIVYIIYKNDGVDDWNFKNTLPVANVSQFIFFTSPLCFLLPTKIRKYYFTLISLLSLGMLLSPIINCIRLIVIDYSFHPHFLLDYFSHIFIAFWGIYLVYSKQVHEKIKSVVYSGLIIIFVAFLMMLLNVIFDKAFFGLSLNGKHNIYNVVLVSNSYVSALIYFTSLTIVLISGYFYSTSIVKLSNQLKFK